MKIYDSVSYFIWECSTYKTLGSDHECYLNYHEYSSCINFNSFLSIYLFVFLSFEQSNWQNVKFSINYLFPSYKATLGNQLLQLYFWNITKPRNLMCLYIDRCKSISAIFSSAEWARLIQPLATKWRSLFR